MSTRSATIIRQTTYWGEDANTEELMRFYRHCDGYPSGQGLDLASSVMMADAEGCDHWLWVQSVLKDFLNLRIRVEFEPRSAQHGDIEYLYVLEGIVDQRWGATRDGRLPVIISVYEMRFNEDYDVAMEREPLFSGTAYEYEKRFGRKVD